MTEDPSHRDPAPDPRHELSEQSARILDAVDELRRLESQKRAERISTPEFRRLATDVTEKSREIFRMAAEEEETGDESPRSGFSIEDIDREDAAG